MSKYKENRAARKYSIFDSMGTEELKVLLRQDSMLPENEESDIDTIIYISGLIEKREKIESGKEINVNAMWERFCENYYPVDVGENVEIIVYMSNGIEHYILHNTVNLTAVWFTENFEWSIAGASAVDELKKMIDSVYKVRD